MASLNNNGTLAGKNGGVIVVGGEAGHVATINDLTNFFLVNSMMIIGSSYWNIEVPSKKGYRE
ncbi:hypothetical protein PV797_02860 [Clostridiaceae bacterium M8S5]|nr:hypothetical protein PV797_02860 [Clostridiaceae bacterium M8S5]